jgi:hypothetical protein
MVTSIAVAFTRRAASMTRYSASLEHSEFMDVQFYIAYFTKQTVGQNLCDMKKKKKKKGEKNEL